MSVSIKNTTLLLFCSILVVFSVCAEVQSQEFKKAEFNYISPVAGSKYVMPQNNIALRHGDPFKIESLQNFSIQVHGSKSGRITGKVILSDDARTIIYLPDKPFAFGEEVRVAVIGGLETKTGLTIEQKNFSFSVTSSIPKLPANYFSQNEIVINNHPASLKKEKSLIKFEPKDNNLPDDFPQISVNLSDDLPPEGYYFVAPFASWGWYPDAVPYLIIMDEFGVPVFYRKNSSQAYDFKKLYNGNMVYYANFNGLFKWVVEDDAYNIVDFWAMKNGYWTDWHEFQLLSEPGHEGHAIVIAYDPQFVDMSQVVPGGNPNAIVSGWIIQEQDSYKNVIFQWSSWDHFLITDAHEHVDLTDSIIDPIHGNAVEVYSGNELLLSARNTNEITKINWNTGSIVWRFGGENNMFEYINDTLGFSMQHDCRRLDNGNLSIFDNGTYHPVPFSSTVEYVLDETNYTATLVNRFRNYPDAFGNIMGNAQKTTAGNTVAGWGSSGEPALTEFNSNGEVVAEINIESINYRAYRFPWETSYFSVDTDSLHFGYIYYENEVTKTLKIQNNMDFAIEISSFYSMSNAFSIPINLPITIQAGFSKYIPVLFDPTTPGNFKSVFTINSDINTANFVQRIAQQLYVQGYASENQSIADHQPLNVKIYPNPVRDILLVEFYDNHLKLEAKILDSQSKTIYSCTVKKESNLTINMKNYTSGIYYLQVEDKSENKFGRYKIIKQ